MTTTNNQNNQLESGTYEIIRNRLEKQAGDLKGRLEQLNVARREVFGAIETQLIANDRINTENYCTARDIIAIGPKCIFGYNVHIGLRAGIQLKDVFSIYSFAENSFEEENLDWLNNEKFQTDFQNLYRYYKEAYFARFVVQGAYLYMVFHISKQGEDFKAFKWLIKEHELVYIDARADHEVKYPKQHEFQWIRAHREMQRAGKHPHVAIMDRIFVETVGGDLTIKVEDNTEDGLGIYREEVDYADQTLDDAEYFYADLGNLIVLKIRPYQEEFRYFVFNQKMQEVQRIDSLEDSGVLLPDQHGLIFANGYYLQTGEYKIFDPDMRGKQFKRRITSPNGEDFLYVFYNNRTGTYVLLHYNLISQQVNTPIICHGYTHFPDGELCYFRAEEEPTKHHVMQIWQTPFIAGNLMPSEHTDSYLYKIGNKDIVKAMAECQEVLILAGKTDSYDNLYHDLARKATDLLDAYYWIDKAETFQLNESIQAIGETATVAIEAYEKKVRIEKSTTAEIKRVQKKAENLFGQSRRETFDSIDLFVKMLADLRMLRGEIISLKDLRYTKLDLIETLEEQCVAINAQISEDCVAFLMGENALQPYLEKIEEEHVQLAEIRTAKEAKALELRLNEIGEDLELLIDIVSNLKIEDATQTTRIIDHISSMYARLNQVKAAVKKTQQGLMSEEAIAEFGAQLKLLDQGIINYLDIADTPQKCDEYLTKLMVQLEELEGKFVEFDDFILQITEKREEVYTVFETRKNSLVEARNNRTTALQKAAERILNGIKNRVKSFEEVSAINGFFAADLMIDKVRDLIQQLMNLEDSNKANSIQTQLKTLQEESIRQLRDRQDLFVSGENIIKLGQHHFSVNVQPLDLTIVQDSGQMHFHLTGTDFFETITDPDLLETRAVWSQQLVSENEKVYRAEYLAYRLFFETERAVLAQANDELLNLVQQEASQSYREGYSKGIHDEDASNILGALIQLSKEIDLLSFSAEVRACAQLLWHKFIKEEEQKGLHDQLKSARSILTVFPDTHGFDYLIDKLEKVAQEFVDNTPLFPSITVKKVATYLFRELSRSDDFIVSQSAADAMQDFFQYLKGKKSEKHYRDSVFELREKPIAQYQLVRHWVEAFAAQTQSIAPFWIEETATLLLLDNLRPTQIVKIKTTIKLEGLYGNHPVVDGASYVLDYNEFMLRMDQYTATVVPQFKQFSARKTELTEQYRKDLRLETFKPRVLSSFVRNKLIDQVYLPIFGDNLAKQIGATGENTRTDRMGMLLLISPPGYGKTTLMEYIAERLGLIFMKINGPALGHQVNSLDPADAPNMAARQELQKLNLALEMKNNVMLYVDDIQHCNPEFLQKFISLCDAQRKIEGVYKGESKTYDLRGKRFCVIMAGNPYTESGDKFQIPDMLANRSDIYNLGDIIGDSAEVFKLSYIENAITSNPVLQKLARKSMKDVYALLQYIEKGSKEGIDFETNHAPEELNEYAKVMGMLLQIRDWILEVNQEYIRSAAMEEDYRTEPAFKLQGSYRNMNKLAEKVVSIMNEKELETMILAHYEGEAQTLTSGAEANFLKLKSLLGILNAEEAKRWQAIIATFNKNKVFRKVGDNDPVAQVVAQLSAFTDGLEGIRQVLAKGSFGGRGAGG